MQVTDKVETDADVQVSSSPESVRGEAWDPPVVSYHLANGQQSAVRSAQGGV